jgi:hypothetical protein
MNSLTRLIALSLICSFFTIPLSAQNGEETPVNEKKKARFSLTFGAAAGNFAIDAPDFNSVYSNRSISKIYFAGFGSNLFYVIAKYREFYARGRSSVENIDVAGKAEWKQRFFAGGIRLRADDQPIYADLLYVVTKAEEIISTADPVVERLTTRYDTENKGGGFAVGVSMKLIGPIGIFVEGEYTIMTRKGRNQLGRVNPELGGFCASAGAHFAL